ncbi:MAG: toxin ParE1/3/4 [Gammaproteobacteria bacterium]|jgi:toxin ParE1/3/4
MPIKPAEYRLTPEAERDMETIWLYTLEEWGLKQANRYTDELAEAFAQLGASPKMGTPCDHIRKGYRRSRIGRHAIYFRLTHYGIAVIRVLHDRMLSTRHL